MPLSHGAVPLPLMHPGDAKLQRAGNEHGARTLQKQACFGPHCECADSMAVG